MPLDLIGGKLCAAILVAENLVRLVYNPLPRMIAALVKGSKSGVFILMGAWLGGNSSRTQSDR